MDTTLFPKTCTGLEIAGQNLRIVVVRKFLSKSEIVKTHTIEGLRSAAPEDQLGILTSAVKQFGLSTLPAFLSLPGDCGILRQMEFPAAVRAKLADAVALQVENLSPWSQEDVYWSFAAEAPTRGQASFQASVSIIPRATLDFWIELFRQAGLQLSGALVAPLVWAHGAYSLWGDATPTAILNSEPGHVDGTLIHKNKVTALGLNGEDEGAAAATMVQRLISLGRVTSPETLRIVECGNVAIGDGSRVAPNFGAESAAMLGLNRSPFTANLIPADQRYRRSRVRLIPTVVLAALCLVLAAGLSLRELYQMKTYADQLDVEIEKLVPEVKSVAAQEAELSRLTARSQVLISQIQSRDANIEALRELAHVLPQGTWLNSYNYQDKSIVIAGLSESAAETQKLLESSPVFSNVQFTSPIVRDASGKDRFFLRANMESQP